jgi:hypothetical protein
MSSPLPFVADQTQAIAFITLYVAMVIVMLIAVGVAVMWRKR